MATREPESLGVRPLGTYSDNRVRKQAELDVVFNGTKRRAYENVTIDRLREDYDGEEQYLGGSWLTDPNDPDSPEIIWGDPNAPDPVSRDEFPELVRKYNQRRGNKFSDKEITRIAKEYLMGDARTRSVLYARLEYAGLDYDARRITAWTASVERSAQEAIEVRRRRRI